MGGRASRITVGARATRRALGHGRVAPGRMIRLRNDGWWVCATGASAVLATQLFKRRSLWRTSRHWAAAALCSIAWSAEASVVGFADVVVEYFDSGNGSLACQEGQGGSFPPSATLPTCVPFSVALGDDPNYPAEPADYLSLPMGSFITLGFVDEVIVDGEGDDLFIQEVGDALETADIYVSSLLSTDPNDFVLVGQANGNTVSSFDLGAVEFTDQVRAVKIVSLQNGGAPAAPGFDLANVQALAFQEIPPAVPSSNAFGLVLLCALLAAAGARDPGGSRDPSRARVQPAGEPAPGPSVEY